MSEVTYQVDAATLPPGSCPATDQELADLLASIYSVTVNTNNTGIVVSSTKPADTTVVWKQINTQGQPIRDYIFVGGLWLSRHTMASGEIVLWRGSVSSIWSFDGGDGTDPTTSPPTPVSGAMWRVVSEMSARVPLGVGTLPSGAAVSVGDTSGEEKHILTQAELPASFSLTASLDGHRTNTETLAPQWLAPPGSAYASVTNPATEIGTFPFVNSGGGQGANNLPPYFGIYFIERTAKAFYVVP